MQGENSGSTRYAWAVVAFVIRVFPTTFKYSVRHTAPRFFLLDLDLRGAEKSENAVMKKLLSAIIVIVAALQLNAQDVIYLTNGDEVKAKVEEITETQIKYKQWDNQTGPLRSFSISNVFMIIYENGQKEVFTTVKDETSKDQQEEIESHRWVDLGLPSGTLWRDQNEEVGGFYTYEQAVSKYGNNLPTKDQFEELKNLCQWIWMDNVYKVIGPNGEFIVLPAMGRHNCTEGVMIIGSRGYYWSSTPGVSSGDAWCLYFNSSKIKTYKFIRCNAFSVRLVKNDKFTR